MISHQIVTNFWALILTKINIAIFVLLPLAYLNAQNNDELNTDEVNVVKDFNPIIEDANKINLPLQIEEEKPESLEFDYTLPEKLLLLQYPQNNLKPLAIAKEKSKKFLNNYARAGIGTQYTPLAELYFLEGKPEKFSYGALAKYQSAHGQNIKSQDYTDTDLKFFAQTFFKTLQLKSTLKYEQDINFYYGYDVLRKNDALNFEKLAQKTLKQKFNQTEAAISLLNTKKNENKLDYEAHLKYNYLWDKFNLNEQFINVQFQAKRGIHNKHFLTLKVVDDYSVFEDINNDQLKRNIFGAYLKYHYLHGDWNIFAAANPVLDDSKFYLFPDIGLQRSIYEDKVILYNGWRMELQKNSYNSFTQANPWLKQILANELTNSWYEERFMGLKGSVKKFNYNLRFAQNVFRKMPVFVLSQDITSPDSLTLPKFGVLFDRRTNILNFHIELGYRFSSHFEINSVLDFNNYEQDKVEKIYHAPEFNFKFNARYVILEKIILQLDLIVKDGVYANTAGLPFFTNTTENFKKLSATADVNIGGTYIFSERLSYFIQLNNIAAIKYQTYYLYPSYGFNGMLGLTWKF